MPPFLAFELMIAQSDTRGTNPATEAFNRNVFRLDSRGLYQTGTGRMQPLTARGRQIREQAQKATRLL